MLAMAQTPARVRTGSLGKAIQQRCPRDNNTIRIVIHCYRLDKHSALLANAFLVRFSRQGSLAKECDPQKVAAVACCWFCVRRRPMRRTLGKRERPVWMDTEPLPGSR